MCSDLHMFYTTINVKLKKIILFVRICNTFCPDTFCPTHFKVNTFCPDTFCPTITFFMATTWSITWRCISIGKSVITILLRYNSLPCGTECFTGCREAQTTNAREKQACSWFGLIGCRDVITSCVSASFSLVAAILDALLSFQSCFFISLDILFVIRP